MIYKVRLGAGMAADWRVGAREGEVLLRLHL